jgi:hypothetical protein
MIISFSSRLASYRETLQVALVHLDATDHQAPLGARMNSAY